MTQFSESHFSLGWSDTKPCAPRPVIGVLCCNEFSQRPIQAVATRFVAPLANISGATVVLIPAVSNACDALALADRLDGLLLTGSRSNVEPIRYGQISPHVGPVDDERDEVALRLAAHMIEAGRPVFGICRGLQEINVLFGGTLTGTIDSGHHCGLDDGTHYARHFDHCHDMDFIEGGLLSQTAMRVSVNSVHRQGIDRLGDGLSIEATAASDGLVEAFSARPCGATVLAVQWHPEWDAADNQISHRFFDLIGAELAVRAGRPYLNGGLQ